MAAFEYEALDSVGKRMKGVISADSPRLAARQLKAQQLLPLRIAPAKNKRALPNWAEVFARRGLKPKDLTLFTRQMATLLAASSPVEEALQTIAMQSDDHHLRKVLMNVRASVMEGHKLSDALSLEKGAFPPLYRTMVGAGETSGDLAAVLERLADYLERAQKIRAKVVTTLVYPCVLALTAVAVVIGLMTFVVPKVVEQFDSLGGTLPMLTRMMIWISDAMRVYGIWALLLLMLAGIGFTRALKSPIFALRVDRIVLRLPLIGKLVRDVNAARLARTLASLVASGTPVLEALMAARATVSNRVLSDALGGVITMVREGASLSKALRRAAVFPPMVIYMTAVGERSGQLPAMLDKVADHLENNFETFTATALSLLEPAIIIVMGVVVATIVLSILLPILQLNSLALG